MPCPSSGELVEAADRQEFQTVKILNFAIFDNSRILSHFILDIFAKFSEFSEMCPFWNRKIGYRKSRYRIFDFKNRFSCFELSRKGGWYRSRVWWSDSWNIDDGQWQTSAIPPPRSDLFIIRVHGVKTKEYRQKAGDRISRNSEKIKVVCVLRPHDAP